MTSGIARKTSHNRPVRPPLLRQRRRYFGAARRSTERTHSLCISWKRSRFFIFFLASVSLARVTAIAAGKKKRKNGKEDHARLFVASRDRENVYPVIFIRAPTSRDVAAALQPLLLNQGCWLSLGRGYKISGVTPLLTALCGAHL